MKISFIILMISISYVSLAQADCAKFKTGKFVNIDKNKSQTLIERDHSFQTERMGDVEVKLKITWINDCTYKLKLVSGNDAFWNSRPKNAPIRELIVTITKTSGNSYFQESQSEGEDYIYKSEIKKIE